jgi:hypothetical protein
MLKAMPRNGIVVGDYSPLQLRWMERRFRNAMGITQGSFATHYAPAELERSNMFGIVGLPNKTVVIQRHPHEWRNGTPAASAVTIKEVAQWLADFGGS